MKNILKHNFIYIAFIALFALFAFMVVAQPALADHTPDHTACQALDELNQGANCATDADGSTIKELASTIINWLSYIIGVLSVIMIIIGGFRFLTSSGDAGKVAAARSTIIYAVVGLIVAIFAQAIVAFVLTEATPPAGGDTGYLDSSELA